MYLHDTFRICLLALDSRYPHHSIHINQQVLGSLDFCEDCWKAQDLIELLEESAPQLLKKRARLVIDDQASEMYLVEEAEEILVLWIHCRGIIPPPTGDINTWRRKPVTGEITNE